MSEGVELDFLMAEIKLERDFRVVAGVVFYVQYPLFN